MATGQSLLDLMEVINAELQLQSGEVDVAKGLRALNAAQDYFEGRLSLVPGVWGGQTGTVTTTVDTETTSFPSGLLRVDRLQFIDPSTNLPSWDLNPLYQTGAHATSNYWPWNLITASSVSRKPVQYWTDGRSIYWSPLPDGTHTVRWYGLQAAADITAGGTFTYPDLAMLPLASFANRLIKSGLDDSDQDMTRLATELFDPLIESLSRFRREGPRGFIYRYHHRT